jgi:hypothetical protein
MRRRKKTTILLAVSLALAAGILCWSCTGTSHRQYNLSQQPEKIRMVIPFVPPIDHNNLFILLKGNRVDEIVGLLPTEIELDLLAGWFSFPRETREIEPTLSPDIPLEPWQLVKDLGTSARLSQPYLLEDAKKTVATMREALRKNLDIVMKTCAEQGLRWENATLVKAAFRYQTARNIEGPFKTGMRDGYLVLTISDGSVELAIRFRMIRSSRIDSGVFVETLSKDERESLENLAHWMGGYFESEKESPEHLLALLLRHKLMKDEIMDWLGPFPVEESEGGWTYRSVGLRKSSLDIHFGKDDRVSAIFLDGKPIKPDSK